MHLDTHGLPPTSIDHIAYVVADIDKMIEFLRDTFGLGPWTTPVEVQMDDTNYLSIGDPFLIMYATTVVGTSKIDVIQPLDDDSTFAKFLKETGGGLHHVAFGPRWCSDEAREKIREQPGVKVMQKGALAPGQAWEYYGHDHLPNVTVEIVDPLEHLGLYHNFATMPDGGVAPPK